MLPSSSQSWACSAKFWPTPAMLRRRSSTPGAVVRQPLENSSATCGELRRSPGSPGLLFGTCGAQLSGNFRLTLFSLPHSASTLAQRRLYLTLRNVATLLNYSNFGRKQLSGKAAGAAAKYSNMLKRFMSTAPVSGQAHREYSKLLQKHSRECFLGGILAKFNQTILPGVFGGYVSPSLTKNCQRWVRIDQDLDRVDQLWPNYEEV